MKRLLAVLLLVSFSGCMKIRQEFVVLPDGSGKMTLLFTIRNKGDAGRMTQEALMAGDPDELTDKMRGFVAMTRPTMDEKDGAVRIQATMYFEDLNAVKFFEDDPKAKPKQEFSFRKDGEGYVVEAKGNLLTDELPERPEGSPEVQRQREEMFRAMFVGFEFGQSVRMPGPITAIEGYQSKEERTAAYVIGEKQLQRPADQKIINGSNRFKIVCGKSVLGTAELEAFRQEITQAKADWVELRAEMKRAADKRK